MTKREQLESKTSENVEKIEALKKENIEIAKELCLLCDDKQWFTETIETTTQREGRKKIRVDRLIGRINWKENFKDDDTGEVITIERRQVVRIDGNWE